MELDDFKTTWQSQLFITEVKEMTDIQKIIQQNMVTILERIMKRYRHMITSALIGTVLFILFFYAISDGFRESPLGLVVGVLLMISAAGFGWSRYQQLLALDYATSLKDRLQGLVAQRRRSRIVEQFIAILGASVIFVVPRLFNGRGFSNLTQPDMIMTLAIALLLLVGLLFLIYRYHQRDIDDLQKLLTQLSGE